MCVPNVLGSSQILILKDLKKKLIKNMEDLARKCLIFFIIDIYVKAMSTEKNWVIKFFKFNEEKKMPVSCR